LPKGPHSQKNWNESLGQFNKCTLLWMFYPIRGFGTSILKFRILITQICLHVKLRQSFCDVYVI